MYITPTGEVRAALDWLEMDEILQKGRIQIESKLEIQYARLSRLITVDGPPYDAPPIVVVQWGNAVLRTAFRILHQRDSQRAFQKLYDDFYAGLPIDMTMLTLVLRVSDYVQ
jgi:hypothetical protein